jgi:hypothetical protein
MCDVAFAFRLEDRVAVRDARALRHAVEQGQAARLFPEHPAPEVEKALMHVMRRQRGGDTIDEGIGHVR